MQHITIEVVEEILNGKISTNPSRFEEANGIVFSVHDMSEPMADYFRPRGVEFHELVSGIYYTETVMSFAEFVQLAPIMHAKQVA
jgi:CRISPR/Cas system-associated endonuclease Cas3-HD